MKKEVLAAFFLVVLLLTGAILVNTPPALLASTDEGNDSSDNEEQETESNDDGGDTDGGGSTDEDIEPEPEPEDTPPIQTDEPLAPLQPLVPETEIIPEEPEPEPINVCKSGLIFDTELGKCVPDALTELEELVGPPPECPPELGLTPLECLDEVVKPPVQEPPVVETEVEPETEVEEPIDPCLLDPDNAPECPDPDPVTGECPTGYNMNENGNCYPEHPNGCPKGYHSHEDDETGKCIPNSTPCDKGFILTPNGKSCEKKERVCEEFPNTNGCKDRKDKKHDHDDKDITIVVNKIIKETNNNHHHESFPEIDIIGLSTKDNGDSMVCLINIDDENVQCQDFGMAKDRVNDDFWRVIETDHDKDYDDGDTGSNDIDGVIDDIKSQDFSELDDATNHDFGIDLAWIAINPQGEGAVCLSEDSTGKGKSLCEPFKVSSEEIDGQITEGVAFS